MFAKIACAKTENECNVNKYLTTAAFIIILMKSLQLIILYSEYNFHNMIFYLYTIILCNCYI